jgi:small-conductance mechanosensitive channel
MQVHGGPQIDLSAQVAKVKAKTRPWKSIIALILAIGAAITAGWAHKHFFNVDPSASWVITASLAIAFCVFASAATIGLSGKARSVLEPVMGTAHAAIVRYALVLVGAVTTLVVTLLLFDVPVGQLLLGGALTTVFVGIAAQQALSNVFAGMVLLLARPFKVGDAIRMRAGALSGEVDGTVTEVGITYVRLSTVNGMLSVPNSQVLNAVIGPLPPQDAPPPITPDPWPVATPATVPAAPPQPDLPPAGSTEQPGEPGTRSVPQ